MRTAESTAIREDRRTRGQTGETKKTMVVEKEEEEEEEEERERERDKEGSKKARGEDSLEPSWLTPRRGSSSHRLQRSQEEKPLGL